MRLKMALGIAFALALATGAAVAGGCLQGTWHYFDSNGRLVGEETVGCGADDGAWGTRTSSKSFSQGCGISGM